MKTKKMSLVCLQVFVLTLFLLCGNAFADLTGVWNATGDYTRPDGSTDSGTSILDLFQSGSEITGDSITTSTNNIHGRLSGTIILPNTGSNVIASPYRLIRLTRVDTDGGNYTQAPFEDISKSRYE